MVRFQSEVPHCFLEPTSWPLSRPLDGTWQRRTADTMALAEVIYASSTSSGARQKSATLSRYSKMEDCSLDKFVKSQANARRSWLGSHRRCRSPHLEILHHMVPNWSADTQPQKPTLQPSRAELRQCSPSRPLLVKVRLTGTAYIHIRGVKINGNAANRMLKSSGLVSVQIQCTSRSLSINLCAADGFYALPSVPKNQKCGGIGARHAPAPSAPC